jgi:hypothetical protein
LLAFINSFGYDMQKSTPQQFKYVALQAKNAQVLRNLVAWLPKLGLQPNAATRLIADAVEAACCRRDLSDIAGTWADDPALDAALAEQDTVWPTGDHAESDSAARRANS